MDIIYEIIEYIGTKDARITIYGAILGMMVVFIIRRIVLILAAWKDSLSKGGKKGFNSFLSWLGYHYKDCPKWLKTLVRFIEKVLNNLGYRNIRKTKYKRRNKKQ